MEGKKEERREGKLEESRQALCVSCTLLWFEHAPTASPKGL